MTDIMGAEDGVDPGRPLHDLVPVFLGQATADGDLQSGPLLFERPELAEVAIKPVVGVLPYAAGVENNDVGVLDALRRDHSFGFEQAGQALGVVLVHLAAEGAHQIATGLGRGRRHRFFTLWQGHPSIVDAPASRPVGGVLQKSYHWRRRLG